MGYTTIQEIQKLAQEWDSDLDRITADLNKGVMTAEECLDRMCAEIYGDGGLAGY